MLQKGFATGESYAAAGLVMKDGVFLYQGDETIGCYVLADDFFCTCRTGSGASAAKAALFCLREGLAVFD